MSKQVKTFYHVLRDLSGFFFLQYVYVTGGCAKFDNFKERLERDLLAMRPFQSNFAVYTAKHPILDAWYGARKWSLTPALQTYSVTRAEYEEKGGEYLKESKISNWYHPTPTTLSKTASSASLSRCASSASLNRTFSSSSLSKAESSLATSEVNTPASVPTQLVSLPAT